MINLHFIKLCFSRKPKATSYQKMPWAAHHVMDIKVRMEYIIQMLFDSIINTVAKSLCVCVCVAYAWRTEYNRENTLYLNSSQNDKVKGKDTLRILKNKELTSFGILVFYDAKRNKNTGMSPVANQSNSNALSMTGVSPVNTSCMAGNALLSPSLSPGSRRYGRVQ